MIFPTSVKSVSMRVCLAGVILAMCPMILVAQPLIINGETIADATLMFAARKEGKLQMLYTRSGQGMEVAMEAFQKDTGVKAQGVRLTTEKLYARVMAEFSARRLDADYVDVTDMPLALELVRKGVLNQPHKTPSFERIPVELRDPDGRWYGVTRSVSVINVNKVKVKQADYPRSWKDALNPRWSGRITMPSIDVGGSAFSLYAYLRDDIDKGFWKQLAALKPRIFPSVAPTLADLVRGESHIMLGGVATTIEQIENGAPLDVVFPSEGLISFVLAGGITSVAKNPNAAKLYMNWITSRRGSEVMATTAAYGPHPDAAPPRLAGLEFPTVDNVRIISAEKWERVRDSYITEWRDVMDKK